MTRLEDVINRVRSGDKSVFTDTSTQITGQTQKQTAQTPQLTGSRLDQIIARVKSGDKSVFSDTTTNYVKPVQKQTPDLFGWERDKKSQNFIDRYGQRNTDVEDTLAKVDTAFIQQYMTDVQKYAQNANSQSAGVTSDTMEAFLEKNLHDTYDLKVRGEAIRKYLEQNPNAYGDKYQSLMDYVTSSNDGITQYRKSLNQAEDEILAQKRAQDPTWFQTDNPNGANFWQRAGATLADVGEEIGEGIMEAPEKILDAMLTVAPYFAQGQYYQNGGGYNLQADRLFDQSIEAGKQGNAEIVAKDLYNSEKLIKSIGIEALMEKVGVPPAFSVEEDSVLGSKSEALLSSLGQMIATKAVSGVVPWWMISGSAALGSEAESALNQGATLDEAAASGLVSATAEVLTEKLFGGSGLGEKGLINLEPLTKGISNKLLQTLAKYGVDMASEGLEEAASELAGNLASALYKEENLAQLLASEEALQSYLDAFVGGAVMSGTMNLGSTVSDVASIIHANQNAQKLYGTDPGALITESLEIDPNNAYAQKMQDRLNKGKRITGNQLNQMVQKNEAALKAKDLQAIQDAAQSRLEALGEPEGAKAIAEAIAKKTAGQELSGADELLIHSSKYAQRVLNELNAENIRSGDYASDWTGNINTERVNTDVYGKTAATDVLVGAKMTEKATDPEAVVTNQHGISEEVEEYGRRHAEWEKRNAEGRFNSVGAASEGFTPPGPLDTLNEKYGEQDTRPGDRRYVNIPRKDASGRLVSNFAGNAYGSYLTTDSFASVIEQLTLRGELSHDTLTNEKVLEDAAQTIAEDGISKSISEIQDTAEKGFARPEDIAKGTLLYRYLLEMTDEATDIDVKEQLEDLTAEVFTSLSKMATSAGRSTQLFSLFRRMSPSGQIKTIENDIRDYVARMKRLNQLPVDYVAPSLSADNPLFQAFADASEAERAATTNKEKAEARKRMADAEDEIYKFIASQIPATQKNRWDCWRNLAMLGNIRTQLRNFISTAAFMPYRAAKQALGAVIEKSIPQEQRTKAVIGFSKADRALLAWAKQDRTNVDVQRALRYSARLGDNAASAFIEDHRKIYKNKKLEEVRKFVRKVPQEADLLFKNVEYAKSLAGFLKARGYTEADILSAKVPDDVLTEGREYAIHDAMVATFNDTNALSDAAVALRYTGKNKPLRLLSMLGEGAAPYRRTTANLAVRGFEYSAAGLAKGLWNSARNVKDGKITAAQAIDQISAGLTGTMAACLGFALAGGLLGLRIRGNSLDEDEKRNGAQEYSLEFSFGGKDYSYKIDWIGPAALPLFLGANIRDALEASGQNPDTSLFTKSAAMAKAVFDPMIDMTILSTMNDVLMDARYASEGTELLTVMTSLATSYFTQGIPALARQLVQAIPENRRETFANAADPTDRSLQRSIGNIPVIGQLFKTDAINEWGEGESQGSLLRRLFDSFVNPGALREIDNSPLTQEITRLNQSQVVNASPPDLQKVISYKSTDGKTVYSDRRLTAQEYIALEKAQGQLQQDLASALISSADYAVLSDEQKALALQDVYSYAREKSRMSVFSDYPGYSESWMADIEGDEIDAIICRRADHSISRAFLTLTDAWDSGFSDKEAIAELDAAYKTFTSLTEQNRATVKENMSGGRMSAFVAAKDSGISSAVFAKLYKKHRQIDASENTASAKAREWAVTLAVAQEYDDLTTYQADVLKNKLSFYAHIRQETGRYDDMVSGGLSPEAADYVSQLVDSITAEQGYTSVRNIQQLEAIAQDTTLTERQQDQALRAYMGDSLEEKYDKALSKGIDSDDFVEAYRAYLDTDKKQSFITYCVQELHVSYAVAQKLYDIYGGKK